MQGRVSFKTCWDEEGNEPFVLLSKLVLLSLHLYPSSLGGVMRPKPHNRPRKGHCPLLPSPTQTIMLPYIINAVASLTISAWQNIHMMGKQHTSVGRYTVLLNNQYMYCPVNSTWVTWHKTEVLRYLPTSPEGFSHSKSRQHCPSILRFELLNLLYHRLLLWKQHWS